MADSFQDKSEKPTGKRLDDARKEGNVAKSQDINSAFSLLTGTVGLIIFGPRMANLLKSAFVTVIARLNDIQLTTDSIPALYTTAIYFVLQVLGPILLALLIAGVAASLLQTGWLFSTKAIEPKLSKLSPLSGLKRLFGSRGLVELAKGMVKLVIVGWIGYVTVRNYIPLLIPLMDEEVGQLISTIGSMSLKLALKLTLAFAFISIIDYAYQKWKYIEELKMTKQEVKEEHRQMDGDPKVKGKIRQIQFQTSMNMMIKKIPEADVVLANPIHLAVALKYDPGANHAPMVIAKGKRKIAERIKEIARQHGIPVIEDPELARALFKSTEIGQEVPYDLYQAVAEILAMVYRLKQKAA